MLGLLIAFLSALTVGSLTYSLTSGLPLTLNFYAKKLNRSMGKGVEANAWARIGQRAMATSSIARFLPIDRISADLPWAQLAGRWLQSSVEEVVGMGIAGAGVGLVLGLVAFEGGLIAFGVAGLGFYIPIMLLRSAANDLRRMFRRQLPEMVQVIAAEVGAGTTIEMALIRLASSPTVVGVIFSDLLARSQGKSLFATDDIEISGLQDAVGFWNLPELTNLVAQLTMVQRRGVYGAEVLSGLARRVAVAYLGERERKAESLENDLLVPLVVFFFVPFLLMVLGPIFAQLFAVL